MHRSTNSSQPFLLRSICRLLAVLLLLGALPSAAQERAILEPSDRFHPVYGRDGMVSSQKAEATRVGVEILRRGGNAVDAAVGVGFALAVVLPRAGNLGGGGFMLVHLAEKNRTESLDYRESAPDLAHRDMFLDENGEVDPERTRHSHLAAGIPGTPAGLVLALERFGTLPLEEVIAPAIELAEKGFPVTREQAEALESRRDIFARWPASKAIFVNEDGPWQAGDLLVQKDLAWSLRQLAKYGPKAFYEGPIAQRLLADMEAHDGLMNRSDLLHYRPQFRPPVFGKYRDVTVYSMGPPSSGGVHLLQMLNILEGYDLEAMGFGSAATIHLMAEAMKLAYADRATHLGDPDYWKVPAIGLTAKEYAEGLRRTIDPERARPSEEIHAGDPMPYEGPDTTHFSVVDRWGNAVSNTYTLNFSFGSGIVAAGTGILLNNEMDDFSAKPGVPNAYGLIGGEANAVAPRKRPLSSMTPTMVFRDGDPVLVTGTPGGSRIITTVLQVVLNVVDHGMNVAEATMAPRIHHQWKPDVLRLEDGFSPDTVRLLEARGHTIEFGNAMGSTQSILITEDGLHGTADPRRPDARALGLEISEQ